VDLCNADSAGISIEKEDGTDEKFYHWVATAGRYSAFLDATLPRYPSACSICLERGGPQRFRVGPRFFDIMGIQAPLVTDGLLLPWQTEQTRGTIFIMAHERPDAFDSNHGRTMQLLADFAAMGMRQRQQHQDLIEQAQAMAAASMANVLAHEINNPLQSLVNLVFLAAQSPSCAETKAWAQDLSEHLQQLSALVAKLLRLPGQPSIG
jgi:signal transduction histidine kinase